MRHFSKHMSFIMNPSEGISHCVHDGIRTFLQSNIQLVREKLSAIDAIVTFWLKIDDEEKWQFENIVQNFKDYYVGCQSPILIINNGDVHEFSSYHRFYKFLHESECSRCVVDEEELEEGEIADDEDEEEDDEKNYFFTTQSISSSL